MPMLRRQSDLLQCDVLVASETMGSANGIPAVVMGFRGAGYMRVNVHGPQRSVHSGNHGGIVRNPAVEMARLVASLFREDGTVAVETPVGWRRLPNLELARSWLAQQPR